MRFSVLSTHANLFLAALLLAACASDPRDTIVMSDQEIAAFRNTTTLRRAETREMLSTMSADDIRTATRDKLEGTTSIVRQDGHGVYVEYTSPDNRVFMWYPGNAAAVKGSWGISEAGGTPQACFNYRNAVHGVTGAFEPKECIAPVQFLGELYVIASRKGDPFNLSSGRIPYVKAGNTVPPWPEDWAAIDAKTYTERSYR